VTGAYTFKSTDVANFKPGSYTFEITGTVGTKSDISTFTVSLVDPCPTASLTLQEGIFADMEYFLRDSSSSETFTTSSMLSSSTPADCGPITVEFYNDNLSKSALDAELFNIDASSEPQSLSVLETQDLGKVGSYTLKYRAYHTNYPDNKVEVS
jgi:hypothetical protein